MQQHRNLSRDEWFPARRRHLSSEKELIRRRDQRCAERRRNETNAPLARTDRPRHQGRHGGDAAVASTAPRGLVACCGADST
jgi:Bacterial protein of unknown function (DUF899)